MAARCRYLPVRGALLIGVNRGESLLPSGDDACTLDLILRHAVERPDAVALKDEQESLTYAELLERVRASAAGLASLGVQPGDRVALWLPNSAAFVATALGCLWLGAPFVPLSLGDPAARLARAVADCDPTVVVLPDSDVQPFDPAAVFGRRQMPDTRSLLENGKPAPRHDHDPDRDAYLIYTSGTTGLPKGVQIPERAMRAAISNATHLMGLDTTTRTLCVSPFHFDGSYGTAFPTLFAGGSLVIPRREQMLFIRPFYRALLEEGITHTGFTLTYLRLLLSSPLSTNLSRSNLRTIGVGGEECLAKDVAMLWDLLPTLRVFNRYGPTETTIQVTTYEILREDVNSGIVPIGLPHPHVNFHIVAEDGTVIRGPDEVGELYIGGKQLMRGYWGDEELTSRVLRDDVVRGSTVYRTGDLVYRDPEGRYVYVDRTDSLVKRNGVRVSLREIVRVLRGVDGVSDAACVAVDKHGHLAIAAFVVAPPDVTVSHVLKAAHDELPTGMVPDEVHLRASFPYNSSGKLDGRQLVAEAERVFWSKTERVVHDSRENRPGRERNWSVVL